jgi:hypothetical protein
VRRDLALDPEPASARAARRFVTTVCAEWDLAHLTEPATVVASELVSDAVCHAGVPLRLSVALREPFLYIVVHDQRPGGGLPPAQSRLVDVFATASGVCEPHEGEPEAGNRVWACLRAVPVTAL